VKESAGDRGGRLRWRLAAAITLKIIALLAIWYWFFRPELRPPADSTAVAAKVFQIQNASH
jgi:multidrug resistance efflux pump